MKLLLPLFTGANLVGLFLYIRSVRAIQHLMQAEGRIYSDFTDGIEFMVTALPALAVCLVLNIVWGIMGVRDAAQFRGYRSLTFCAVIFAVWATTIIVVRRFP